MSRLPFVRGDITDERVDGSAGILTDDRCRRAVEALDADGGLTLILTGWGDYSSWPCC